MAWKICSSSAVVARKGDPMSLLMPDLLTSTATPILSISPDTLGRMKMTPDRARDGGGVRDDPVGGQRDVIRPGGGHIHHDGDHGRPVASLKRTIS